MTDEKTASPEGPAIEKVRRGCLKGEPSIAHPASGGKALFVGGACDGQHHCVLFGDEAIMPSGRYRYEVIVAPGEAEVVIYVIEDMPMSIALERLIEGYKP